MADSNTKPVRSRNAADSIKWKFGVSNFTKHLEHVHSMKLSCAVSLIAVTKPVKLAAWLTLKTVELKQRHQVSFLRSKVAEFVVKFIVIMVG